MSELTKVCTRCGSEYPATREYFTPVKYGKYGLHSQCKMCRRKHKDAHINIYALIDPRTNKPFYIGSTNNTVLRLIEHISESRELIVARQAAKGRKYRAHPKKQRIVDLLDAGLRPQMLVLERVAPDEAAQAEAQWIDIMLTQGIELTNVQPARKGQRLPNAKY